jgi:hypothetical protein
MQDTFYEKKQVFCFSFVLLVATITWLPMILLICMMKSTTATNVVVGVSGAGGVFCFDDNDDNRGFL